MYIANQVNLSCLPRCLLESYDESDSLHIFLKTLFQPRDTVPPLLPNDRIRIGMFQDFPPEFVVLDLTTDPITLP